MGIRKFLVVFFTLAGSLAAQQPQAAPGTPLFGVNAKYANGVAPGYWPQAGAGLVLNVGKGTVNCANTIVAYAGGALTLANNTTNYVYLDTASSCAPDSNTSGFTTATIPIATVVTASGVITTITDDRTSFTTVAASAGTVSGSGTSPKIAVWSGPNAIGSIGTPTLCSGGTPAAAGIDANGNATGCTAAIGTIPHGLVFTADPTNDTDYLPVPFACTISQYTLVVDAGTVTVKFWKVATGTVHPTSSDSISTSGVSLSSGTLIRSTTLSDFTTTSVTANDVMAMHITAQSGLGVVTGVLKCDQ